MRSLKRVIFTETNTDLKTSHPNAKRLVWLRDNDNITIFTFGIRPSWNWSLHRLIICGSKQANPPTSKTHHLIAANRNNIWLDQVTELVHFDSITKHQVEWIWLSQTHCADRQKHKPQEVIGLINTTNNITNISFYGMKRWAVMREYITTPVSEEPVHGVLSYAERGCTCRGTQRECCTMLIS